MFCFLVKLSLKQILRYRLNSPRSIERKRFMGHQQHMPVKNKIFARFTYITSGLQKWDAVNNFFVMVFFSIFNTAQVLFQSFKGEFFKNM
jgi:hypothetical protein